MDYEKKYNEAIEKMRKMLGPWRELAYNGKTFLQDLESIFPELRESEDDRMINAIIQFTKDSEFEGIIYRGEKIPKDQMIAHLEKLKEQKPTEWSQEDEKKIHFLSRLIEFQVSGGEYCFGNRTVSKQEAIEMLQSLRPQPHWKPSEEQMAVLERFLNFQK